MKRVALRIKCVVSMLSQRYSGDGYDNETDQHGPVNVSTRVY